mgnify:CR=1 FL=1
MDIYNLFPTAVGTSVRHLTDSEKKFFEELKYTDRVKAPSSSNKVTIPDFVTSKSNPAKK